MFVSKITLRHLVFVSALVALLAASGCGKKTKEDESSVPNAASADENQMGDSDSGKAMGLQTVHFPYDSFTLDSEGKSVLKANAEILKSKSSLKIQVEGHCDQRGGIQYNIALGEKRANAAKKYLHDLGINGERITVVSFGKEKPIDTAETEEAYAKNRRDNFVVTSR
jgi:peptidoglycan-associated lipoprotein